MFHLCQTQNIVNEEIVAKNKFSPKVAKMGMETWNNPLKDNL